MASQRSCQWVTPSTRVAGALWPSIPTTFTPLTDEFSLAPGLASLRELWEVDELIALHGMAIPYRTRSHFDGQAILETGLGRPDGAADG